MAYAVYAVTTVNKDGVRKVWSVHGTRDRQDLEKWVAGFESEKQAKIHRLRTRECKMGEKW